MRNLFGTDGIRKPIGSEPFTDAGLEQLSHALAHWLLLTTPSPSLLLAHDTRESVSWVKAVLKTHLLRYGITLYDMHVAPTPAAYALMQLKPELSAALIISASHNPYHDNGIKIVDRKNSKLSLVDELHISQLYEQQLSKPSSYTVLGTDELSIHWIHFYYDYMLSQFPANFLHGVTVVLDCAHGATATTAPFIFKTLGAQVIILNDAPNGRNINEDCGAVHPERLAQAIITHKAHIGFAFDGDGDRVIAVTHDGTIKNGDDILALLLDHPDYHATPTVVGTVMSNYGLEHYLSKRQCTLARTCVGDKYICEYLNVHQLLMGGEQSGHIILKDYLGTGDGVFTALRVVQTILLTNNWNIETFTKYPQITISVPVTQKHDLQSPHLALLIQEYQSQLQAGRLLVRYSGTENVLRVMVEDQDQHNAERICQKLSELLQKELM